MSTQPNLSLSPKHQAMLDASAIRQDVADARGYRTLDSTEEIVQLGFADFQARPPALLVPVYGLGCVAGAVRYQIRPDDPRLNEKRRAIKYETPLGARMTLDVPPATRAVLDDPSVPLIFTEGIKKVDAILSAGGHAIGLLGVFNYRGKGEDGETADLPDFDHINLVQRVTDICYDSDVMTNPKVKAALDGLTALLQKHGARVRHIFLPDADDGGKLGIDDFFAAGHTLDDVYALARAAPTKEDADNRPMIDAGNHNLPDVTRQAWVALEAANDPPFLFQHGGVPSRLQYGEDGRMLLVPLTEHRLRNEVAQAAEWYVTKGKEQRVFAAEPPLSVIQNMLAQAELPLPVLRSITETPVFSPDGRLIEAAGFDAASGIYVQPVAGLIVPPVPDTPTATDIAQARTLIIGDLIGDFPFTEQADRAAAVALFLLPFARAMIQGLTPMHGIESPTVGSGKGLLGDVLVRPAFGQHGGMIAEARDDDEWRKRIGAKLREGAPIIHIDNVTRPLDSGALAMALTTGVFSDRILGQTATFRATVHNVWMFTANNPVMSLEIARRTVRIRIDTNEEKPWQRDTFKHKNLRAWADTHRGDLIHAALTLVRAWIVAGKPMADVTLGSYEEWAATMGGILDVAGVMGFLDNLSAFYEAADVEGAAWRQFVALWAAAHGSNKVGVGDLFTLALDVDGLNFGKGGERSQRVSFGSQLTKQRDRIYDGYRITLAGEVNRAKQWRLLPVKSGGSESRQQRFITDSADIATKNDEGMNLYESFLTPRARKNDEEISVEDRGGKIHRDSYGPAFSLTSQGKTVMNLQLEDSPEGERPLDADDLPDRVALRQWAEDEGLGWENKRFPEAAIREATRRYYALTFPSAVPRDEMAKVILAAMKGLPQTKGRAQ